VNVTIHFGTSYKEIAVGAVIPLIFSKRKVTGKQSYLKYNSNLYLYILEGNELQYKVK
jgi:hypothetical protein